MPLFPALVSAGRKDVVAIVNQVWRQRQAGLCEFEASLVHVKISRRELQSKTVSKEKKTKRNEWRPYYISNMQSSANARLTTFSCTHNISE